jgi:hypothetical protein
LVETCAIASENGPQIEAEAVDVHFRYPIAQAIGDHLQHARMAQVHGIASTSVVDVVARFVGQQAIVRSVIYAPEQKGRSTFIPFRSVVVNYVEDDLQVSIMEMGDHLFEFRDRSGCEVTRIRSEEADSIVAPIISQSLLEQQAIVDEGLERKQLDGSDAQASDVVDDFLTRQARKATTKVFRDICIALCETFDVQLV